MNRYSLPLVALSFLAGCATAPPPLLTADNPASPTAAEATVHPLRNTLVADDLTKTTRKILAQSGKQEDQPSPSPTPQQQQMDQMPGMKMP